MVQKTVAKIQSIEEITSDIKIFTLYIENPLEYSPGQFINIQHQTEDNKKINRAYSIASKPKNNGNNYIELCIKKVEEGIFTPKLWEMDIGEELNIMGPLGLFTPKSTTNKYTILIGTGVGIAPLRPILKSELEKKEEIDLIYGARHLYQMCYKNEFENLQKNSNNFNFIPTLSRPENNNAREEIKNTGYVHEHLNKIETKKLLNSDIFICGSSSMVNETIEKLKKLGVDPENIKKEIF